MLHGFKLLIFFLCYTFSDPLRDLKRAANNLRRHFINKFELLTTDSRARAGLSSGAAGLDLVFVFDSSASVGQENFKKGIEFARTIISEFGVSNSTSGTRVAVVVFSSTAEVIYNLQTKRIVDQKAAINTLSKSILCTNECQISDFSDVIF